MTTNRSSSTLATLRRIYRGVAVTVLNVVLLLLVLEVAARGYRFVRQSRPGASQTDEPVSIEILETYDWSGTYWAEHSRSGRKRYEPFTIWRSRPFSGETITVDERGVRRTPGAVCSPGAIKVFTFGGSSMWGHGVPDWETIPAHVQTGWGEASDRPICVENWGERGWVATQGLIELIRQLQIGNVPDEVVFYDGANDVGAAYQSGRSGGHLELDIIADRFERSPLLLADRSALLGMIRRIGSAAPNHRRRLGAGDPGVLGAATVRAYLSTYTIVEAMADAWGFGFHFFWQPVLTEGAKPLCEAERQIEQRLFDTYPDLPLWYASAHDELRASLAGHEHLHDLTDVFDGVRTQTYIDPVHLTPEGNRLVAERILEICNE